MLFHVTMTHTEDNCPGYHVEQMPQAVDAMDKLPSVAEQLGVKIRSLLWGAPEHVAYAVVEADSLSAVAQFVNSVPIPQSFKVTPVEEIEEVVKMAKAMMARRAQG